MRALSLASFGLLVPSLIVGQQVPAELTLEDALDIARARNPAYLQAVNAARAEGAQVRAGWGAFLPTLNAQLQFFGSTSRTVTGEDDFGRPVELPVPVDFRRSTASQTISTGVTLFDGFNNLSTLRAARATAASSDAARDLAGTDVDAETTRRFYDALRTTRLIALEEELLASAREQLSNTQRLFRTAGAEQEDVLGAESAVATQELALERARGEADKARLAIAEHLGIDEELVFVVVGDLPAVWDPAHLNAAALVARADGANSRIRQLEASARAADLQASAARGGRWPTVTASASFTRSMSLSSYEALFKFNPRNRGFQFGMTVNLPLFTGFQTSARIASASLQARNAHESLRSGRLLVERSVRSALIDVRNAHRALELAERAAELSRERLRLTRERYAIGAISYDRLQLVIDRAAQDERQRVTARFQLAQAIVSLEQQVGEPVGR